MRGKRAGSPIATLLAAVAARQQAKAKPNCSKTIKAAVVKEVTIIQNPMNTSIYVLRMVRHSKFLNSKPDKRLVLFKTDSLLPLLSAFSWQEGMYHRGDIKPTVHTDMRPSLSYSDKEAKSESGRPS